MKFKDLKIKEWFFCEDTYKEGVGDIVLLRKVDEKYALNTCTSDEFQIDPQKTVRKVSFELYGKECTRL